MGWGDKKSIEKSNQDLKKSWEELKKSFNQLGEDVREREQRQKDWLENLESIIADPHALDGLSEPELKHLRIQIKGEIKSLTAQGGSIERNRKQGNTQFGNTGFGGLLNLISNIGDNSIDSRMQKNRTVLEIVDEKLKDLRATPPALPPASAPQPPPDPAAAIIAELAEEHRRMEESLKNNPPELHADIKRVYGQRMDAIRKKIGP